MRYEGLGHLRAMSYEELDELAMEIRGRIARTVEKNGGHLASNLGVVELTIALNRVYESPKDKIIFDVGHQCYAHKILTDRDGRFESIRTNGGLSGFPSRSESPHDAFGTGHASTAASAALGFARARDILGQDHAVAVVIGDGALTGGEAYEALNDIGHTQTPIVVILNDNGMSISGNVGALTRTLTRARTAPSYWRFKRSLTAFLGKLPGGGALYKLFQNIKNGIKYLFVQGKFFDALGFVYIGRVDGHDIREMEYTLRRARAINKPVIVHAVTSKGKGIEKAEREPEVYHGVSNAKLNDGEVLCAHAVAHVLKELAQNDPRVVAVTAAMPISTGLAEFGREYPERMFDVGIAEEHAATLCAGFAAAGMVPFFAVYSTFFQRAFDQVLHDAALQNLPVTFLLDRAGLSGEDGVTHQGVYDIAMTAPMPGVTILAPGDILALEAMIRYSASCVGPVVIRYPRALPAGEGGTEPYEPGKWRVVRKGRGRVALIALGPMLETCMRAAETAGEADVSIIAADSVAPLDVDCLRSLGGMRVITLEEASVIGGFGSLVRAKVHEMGLGCEVYALGVPRLPIYHAGVERQKEECGLGVGEVVRIIRELV